MAMASIFNGEGRKESYRPNRNNILIFILLYDFIVLVYFFIGIISYNGLYNPFLQFIFNPFLLLWFSFSDTIHNTSLAVIYISLSLASLCIWYFIGCNITNYIIKKRDDRTIIEFFKPDRYKIIAFIIIQGLLLLILFILIKIQYDNSFMILISPFVFMVIAVALGYGTVQNFSVIDGLTIILLGIIFLFLWYFISCLITTLLSKMKKGTRN